MKKHIRRLALLSILVFSVVLSSIGVLSFDESEHDKYLEQVLFGTENFKKTKSEEIKKSIQALEYASYLALDQYNASSRPKDKEKLQFLKNRGVSKVPAIDDIDFKGNSRHRDYTHRGWDFDYQEDKANWKVRKELLINTVNKELNIGYSGFLWFKQYNPEGKSFAAFIYYIHVLGDYISGEWNGEDPYLRIIHLADKDDKDYSLIEELKKHLKIIFKDQTNSNVYSGLIHEIDRLNDTAWSVRHTEGELNTEEKFITYHQCAVDLMQVLIDRIPLLLKKESFFADVFYND